MRRWLASFDESAVAWAAAPRGKAGRSGDEPGDLSAEALRRWLLGDDGALEEWLGGRRAPRLRTSA